MEKTGPSSKSDAVGDGFGFSEAAYLSKEKLKKLTEVKNSEKIHTLNFFVLI